MEVEAGSNWQTLIRHSASSSRRESFGEANALHRAGDAAPRVVVETGEARFTDPSLHDREGVPDGGLARDVDDDGCQARGRTRSQPLSVHPRANARQDPEPLPVHFTLDSAVKTEPTPWTVWTGRSRPETLSANLPSPRNDDDPEDAPGGPDLGDDVEPVPVREPPVDDGDVELSRSPRLAKRRDAGDGCHPVPLLSQEPGQLLQEERFILENGDASHEGKPRRPGAPDLTSRDHAPAIFLFVRHFVRRGALRPLAHGYPVFLRWSPAPA